MIDRLSTMAAIAAYGYDPLAQRTYEEIRAHRMAWLAGWAQRYRPSVHLESLTSAYHVFKQHGILPFGGGWLEQPAYVIECFEAIGNFEEFYRLQAELERERHDR